MNHFLNKTDSDTLHTSNVTHGYTPSAGLRNKMESFSNFLAF